MIDCIHRSHVGQEGLSGADVGGGLLAPDVLLPRLQGHADGRVTVAVSRDTHDPPRHDPLVGILHRQEPRVGASIAHRHPEPLRGAIGYIGPKVSGSLQDSQREQIASEDYEGLVVVRSFHQIAVIYNPSVGCRVLN